MHLDRQRRRRLFPPDGARQLERPMSVAKSTMKADSRWSRKEVLWWRDQPNAPGVRPRGADERRTKLRQSSCPELPPPTLACAKASSPPAVHAIKPWANYKANYHPGSPMRLPSLGLERTHYV